MHVLLQGLITGFCIAAPVGPINMLCLRRSLVDGRRVGFLSGLGAATADTVYGAIAVLGLTAITDFLIHYRLWLQLFGGIFMCGFGLEMLWARPARRETGAPLHVSRLRDAFVSTFFLTLPNPMTLIAFTGVFAAFGLNWHTDGLAGAFQLIGGVFVGSSLWWLTLALLAGAFGRHLNDGALRWINFGAGLVIATIGAWQLGSLAWGGVK